jgi:hypothetical protein
MRYAEVHPESSILRHLSQPVTRRLPGETASIGIEPPVSRAVPLAFVPGERLINVGEPFDRLASCSPDEPWTTSAVEHHYADRLGHEYLVTTMLRAICPSIEPPTDFSGFHFCPRCRPLRRDEASIRRF